MSQGLFLLLLARRRGVGTVSRGCTSNGPLHECDDLAVLPACQSSKGVLDVEVLPNLAGPRTRRKLPCRVRYALLVGIEGDFFKAGLQLAILTSFEAKSLKGLDEAIEGLIGSIDGPVDLRW